MKKTLLLVLGLILLVPLAYSLNLDVSRAEITLYDEKIVVTKAGDSSEVSLDIKYKPDISGIVRDITLEFPENSRITNLKDAKIVCQITVQPLDNQTNQWEIFSANLLPHSTFNNNQLSIDPLFKAKHTDNIDFDCELSIQLTIYNYMDKKGYILYEIDTEQNVRELRYSIELGSEYKFSEDLPNGFEITPYKDGQKLYYQPKSQEEIDLEEHYIQIQLNEEPRVDTPWYNNLFFKFIKDYWIIIIALISLLGIIVYVVYVHEKDKKPYGEIISDIFKHKTGIKRKNKIKNSESSDNVRKD